MKNTKKLIISCLILFLTAIGCSDYIEFAEKEYQAEREYQLKQYNGDEEDENKSGFLIYHDYEEKQTLDTHKDNQLINGKKGSSFVKEKEHSEIISPNLEEPTKEHEIHEKRRKSYWKRIREQEQNN